MVMCAAVSFMVFTWRWGGREIVMCAEVIVMVFTVWF